MKRVEVPGVGVVEFPDSMTNEQITAALRQRMAPQRAPAGMMETAAVGFGEQLLSNMSGLANLGISGVERAANLYRAPVSAPTAQRPSPVVPGSPLDMLQSTPVKLPRLPSGEVIAALAGSPIQAALSGASMLDIAAGRGMTEPFQRNLAIRRQMAQDNPITNTLATFGADAATLAMGRAPFVRPGGGGVFDAPVRQGVESISRALSGPNAGRVSRTLGDWANSNAFKGLAEGAGRSVEAGLEGAGLSLLQDGDPLETAGYAAGMQAGSSVLNSLFDARSILLPNRLRGTFTGRVASATATAFVTGSLIQFFKSAAPGGENGLIDALESGYDKVIYGAALGAVSSLVGGRPSGTRFPDVMDALQTLPRTSMIKLAQAAAQDPVVERAVQNAPYLSDSDAKRYLDAVQSENPGAAVRELIENVPRIGSRLTAPDPRLATTPVRED